jgi:iron(III) transport system ATP-binding protein
MEEEFARFHERTATTMIYITHDQAEAMALADRIAVMDKGRILQVATPSELYREPIDETVARFIGEGMIVPFDDAVADGSGQCLANVLGHRVRLRHAAGTTPPVASRACVRESALRVVDAAASGVSARVTAVIYQGGHFRVEAIADAAPNEPLHLDVREPASIRAGDRVQLAIDDGWVLPLPDASLQSGKIRR